MMSVLSVCDLPKKILMSLGEKLFSLNIIIITVENS